MFPLVPALAAGAELVGGALGFIGQGNANAANAEQAQKNREFQERMSSTSWQRGVADMRAAGLNPALAYEKGGASSPSGSTAHMENTLAGAASSAGGAVRSYGQMQAVQAQLQNTRAQTEKTQAEARQLNLESALRIASLQAANAATSAGAEYTRQKTLTEKEETLNRGEYRQNQRASLLNMGQDYELGGMLKRAALYKAAMDNSYLGSTLGARVSLAHTAAEMGRYGLPAARNRSDAAETWFGRNIMPYLGSAESAGSILNYLDKLSR